MFLAAKPEGTPTSIRELTQALDIPYHFLGKILQRLTHKGLLTSKKGSSGGFALAHRADDLKLVALIEAIDQTDLQSDCVLGFAVCSSTNPCGLHHRWEPIRLKISEMLSHESVASTLQSMNKPEYRPNA